MALGNLLSVKTTGSALSGFERRLERFTLKKLIKIILQYWEFCQILILLRIMTKKRRNKHKNKKMSNRHVLCK